VEAGQRLGESVYIRGNLHLPKVFTNVVQRAEMGTGLSNYGLDRDWK